MLTNFFVSMASPSSLSTLCSSSSSSLYPSPRFSYFITDKSSTNPNVSLQFLGKRQSSPLLSSTPRFLTVIAMAPPKPGGNAKKVVGIMKIEIEAGKAMTEGPLGKALGGKIDKKAFCKDYNTRTAHKLGYIIPVEITLYDDRSFTFILKTPPTSFLLLKAAGVKKGSKDPKQHKVGTVTIDQLRRIAKEKLPDLNCTNLETAMRIIAGTAANMGIDIDPPVLEPKIKPVLF